MEKMLAGQLSTTALQQANDRAEAQTKRVMKKVYFMAASSLSQSEQLFLHCPQSSDRQRAESHATLPSISALSRQERLLAELS